MPRLPLTSGSRSRNASTRSASTRSASTPSALNWPAALLNSQGSPSTDVGDNHASPSDGSGHRVSSSDGDHSPIHVNINQAAGGDGWHEAFHQANNEAENEAENTEESGINGDHLLEIKFNSMGQPIEEGSKKYATRVGTIARNVVPPHHVDWREVPLVLKEEIWRAIKNEYRVPEIIKTKALRMANKSWKNKKTTLRKWCDKFDTVAERKNNRPNGVRREDWDKFVDLHASEADQMLREMGKEARKLLKALHTTGRDGIARRRYVMEQQSPTGSVSRSVVYLATHVYKEIPQEELELMDPNSYEVRCRQYVAQVRELNETEEYRNETNLDRDAVAKVFGVDDRGVVRGMGGGISKTELIASAVPREQLRQQVLKTRAVEDRVRNLEETVETLMAGLSCNPNPSTSNAQGMNQPAGSQRVILKNMRKRAVAVGYIFTNRPPIDDEFHLVLIDEICLPSESLCEGDGTFRDVSIGDKVMWPQSFVFPVAAGGGGGAAF